LAEPKQSLIHQFVANFLLFQNTIFDNLPARGATATTIATTSDVGTMSGMHLKG